MADIENAFLAAVMCLAMLVPLAAVGTGIKTIVNAQRVNMSICNNYEIDCLGDGAWRPCFGGGITWKTCYPSGYVFPDGTVNP